MWHFLISKPRKAWLLYLYLPFVRSDPAAFESRLEKRSEFRKQPVGHSKQSDFIRCVEQKVSMDLGVWLCLVV